MERILITSPARIGRFGHQTMTILTSIYLAYLTKSKLLLPRYMFFCDKWNAVIDWSKHKSVISEISNKNTYKIVYLEKKLTQSNKSKWRGFSTGGRSWNLEEGNDLGDLISTIEAIKDSSLIFLPFDQTSSYLMRFLNKKEFKDEFAKIFQIKPKRNLPNKPYVCIHIRRGDVSKDHFPHWYVSNQFYIALTKQIFNGIPSNIKVVVCTQGDVGWLLNGCKNLLEKEELERLNIFSTEYLHINDNEIEDFLLMANSHLLFSANSSFSHFAGALKSSSYQIDITRNKSKHYLKNVTQINPDDNQTEVMYKIKAILEIIEWNQII